MHALLFTLLVVGANGGPVEEGPAPKSAGTVMAGDAGYGGGGCNQCGNGNCGGGHHGHHQGGGWLSRGGMPQTCYDPKYGCYGSDRRMQRYPAFHGSYYRRPYNYRNLFDYPWHADLHEPTSLFSYNVVGEAQPAAGGAGIPPGVNPSATSGLPLRHPSSVIASPPTGNRR